MRYAWLIIFLVVGDATSIILRADPSQATSKYVIRDLNQPKTHKYRYSSRLVRRANSLKQSPTGSRVAPSFVPESAWRQDRVRPSLASNDPSGSPLSSQSPPLLPSLEEQNRAGQDQPESSLSRNVARQRGQQSTARVSNTSPYRNPTTRRVSRSRTIFGANSRDLIGRVGQLFKFGRTALLTDTAKPRSTVQHPDTLPVPAESQAVRADAVEPHLSGSRKQRSSREDPVVTGGASTSISRKNNKNPPNEPQLDPSAIGRPIRELNLPRANSDPLRRRYPPMKKSRATVNRPSKSVSKQLVAIKPNSDTLSPPASELSRVSFELDQPRSSRNIESSDRSTIAPSAFASLANGPSITGAGLETTIDAWGLSVLPSLQNSRQTSAGSMGSYELPSQYQMASHNGGTDTGPQNLGSKVVDKLAIARKFFNAHPGEAFRASASAFGHALVGVGPTIANVGGLGAASSVGMTGAALMFLSGGERIIPKIEKWQKDKGGAPMQANPTGS